MVKHAPDHADGNLAQNLVFQMLNLGIEYKHKYKLRPARGASFLRGSGHRRFRLKITDLNPLAHLPQTVGKLLHQPHFDIETNGQIGILVSRIHRTADKEVNVGRILKEETAIREAPSFLQPHCA